VTERSKPCGKQKTGVCKQCKKEALRICRSKYPVEKETYKKKQEEYKKQRKLLQRVKREHYLKLYNIVNREKRLAYTKVQIAIKEGSLPRVWTLSCEDCGANATEYHHEDYTKPLEVVALCKSCHRKRHNVDTSVQHPADKSLGEERILI